MRAAEGVVRLLSLWVEPLPKKPKIRIVQLGGHGDRQHDGVPPDREDGFDLAVRQAYIGRYLRE